MGCPQVGFTENNGDVEGKFERGLSSRKKKSDSPIRQVILAQAIASLLAASSLLLWDWVAAYSALLGGLICVIPNGYLAFRISATDGLSRARRTGRLIQGEAGKLIQTVLLFALVFGLVRPLESAALLLSFIGIQLLHWLVPVFAARVQKG